MSYQDPLQPKKDGFSSDLDIILLKCQAPGMTKIKIKDLEDILKGRGFTTLMIVMCVPFVQPIPVPGLSIIFGLALIAFGLRFLIDRPGHRFPAFIEEHGIEVGLMIKIVNGVKKLFSAIEKWLKPRFLIAYNPKAIGACIMCSGLALSLPIPPAIPFSNSIPAWAVMALALGSLEKDGICITIGYGLTIFTWVYFAIWWEAIKLAVLALLPYLPDWPF